MSRARTAKAPPVSALVVWHGPAQVGSLVQQGDGGLRFTYDAAWITSGFAVSHSLPLREAPFHAEASRFFGNLLPEGAVRTAVCRRLGLSEDGDFALLAALGRECAGALEIVPPGESRATSAGYRPLTNDQLERWIAIADGYGGAVADHLRLSLAGAQDKLGVKHDTGGLWLPEDGAPSTHLLKLPNRDFAALPQNECLVLELARRVGLPAVRARLLVHLSAPVLLVERFDRTHDGGRLHHARLHQEDLCQALGVDRRRKYEAEGGPSFARCAELVRAVSVEPLRDVRTLIEWLGFGVVAGNRDGHAKNLALVRGAGGWRLAPLYDLVCTTAYPRLSRRPAMSIGGRTDAGNLAAVAWRDEAARLDVGPDYVLRQIERIAVAVGESLSAAHDAIAEQLGDDASLGAVRRAIRKGVRSTLAGLRS